MADNIIDLGAAKHAVAEQRLSRLKTLLDSIDVTKAIECESTADYEHPVVLQDELELNVRQLTALLGYSRLPLTLIELRGLLAYGRAVAQDASSHHDATVGSNFEESVHSTVLAIQNGRKPNPLPYDQLHLAANFHGEVLKITGPLMDYLQKRAVITQAEYDETVRLRNQIKPLEGCHPVVVGEYPLLEHPALEPVRKIKLPYTGGMTVGQALQWPHVSHGIIRDALYRVGIRMHTHENYVEIALILDSHVLQKAFKRRPNWAAELSELARQTFVGAEPVRMYAGKTLGHPAQLIFVIPSMKEAEARYIQQFPWGRGQ